MKLVKYVKSHREFFLLLYLLELYAVNLLDLDCWQMADEQSEENTVDSCDALFHYFLNFCKLYIMCFRIRFSEIQYG